MAEPLEVPNPLEFLALPTKVASLETRLTTLGARIDSLETGQNSLKSRIDAAENSIGRNGQDISSLQSRIDQVDAGIDSRVRSTVTQEYVRGFIDKPFVQGFVDRNFVQNFVDQTFVRKYVDQTYVRSFITAPHVESLVSQNFIRKAIDKSYITGLGIPDKPWAATEAQNQIKQMVTSSYVMSFVDSKYTNLRSYEGKLPKLDTIPTDTTIKSLINSNYIRSFVDASFIKGNLPGIDSLLNNKDFLNKLVGLQKLMANLKGYVTGAVNNLATAKTRADNYITHMNALVMNLDDWITGGPDGKRPSVTDAGAWANLFKALKNNMTDLEEFMSAFKGFQSSMNSLKGVLDQVQN